MLFSRIKLTALTALLAAGGSPFVTAAQAKPRPVKIFTVPCCRCVDGSSQTLSINTGAAPWTMTPATPSGGWSGDPLGRAASAAVVAAPVTSHPAWTTAAAPAQWVGVQAGVPGTYVFELPFYVPNCVIRPDLTVSGVFSADNAGVITIDTPTPAFTAPGPMAYQHITAFTFSVTTPGTHVIRVTVGNNEGPTGTVVRGTITVRCPRDPVIPDRSDQLGSDPRRNDRTINSADGSPGTG
jgi:hypothetical protein